MNFNITSRFLWYYKNLLLFILLYNIIISQNIVINEFLASNTTINPEMVDFDDYTDWIELYNPENLPIVLNEFFISDDSAEPLKWKIPNGTTMAAQSYLILWADDFNEIPGEDYTRPYWPWDDFTTVNFHTNFKLSRYGEEIYLFKTNQTENYLLINEGSDWKYLDTGEDQGLDWLQLDFDDNDWNTGYAELGYGDGDEVTTLSYGPDQNNKYITTYFRKSFYVNSVEDFQNLIVKIKRDDGAVIYLNGEEVSRSNMPSGNIIYDTFSSSTVSGNQEDEFYEIQISSNLFLGENCIAVEIHQASFNSSDISFDLSLEVINYSNIQTVDSVLFGTQLSDISYGKSLIDNSWTYFAEPTPGYSNITDPSNILELCSPIWATLESGFYNDGQSIQLYSNSEDEIIYYTLDGSTPTTSSSIIYTEPILINNTTVIKARTFEMNKLPGKKFVSTYFIDEEPSLPTVSFIASPNTLWDQEIGIYSNEYKQREIPVTIEYFENENTYGFIANTGARLGGLNIWTKPQKPFTIYTRNRFGEEFIQYQLFKSKSIVNFSRIVLRNGGDDWEETLIRDPMTESIANGMMDCGYMAYTPVSMFLNGEYWGIHNIREKFDGTYFSENYNVNPENLDHLEYTQTVSGTDLLVIEGSLNNYNSMIEFILNNDLNQSDLYNQLKNWMNIDSFIDHLIMTAYCANTSWEHNREWWRSNTYQNGKWQWLIVDVDRGFNLSNSNTNLLDNLMEDYELFQYLLNSEPFLNRFIQRSAAHLNITFHSGRINSIVDSLSDMISQEIPRHINLWGIQGGINSVNDWYDELNQIKEFSENRSGIVINQFINEFNLDGTVQLSFNIEPSGSGIILVDDIPMANSELQGTYFKNKTLTLKPLPHPGYNFLRWQNITDSISINYNCNIDSSFTAIFQLSDEIILPNIISENTVLDNSQMYVLNNDLTILPEAILTINEGVLIRMPQDGNILVEGQLIINGNEENPVQISPNISSGVSKWGAICFNNQADTSIISNLYLTGASNGLNPLIYPAAISGYNSNIILDNIEVENVEFPIYIDGGFVSLGNSSITTDVICDYINVKRADVIIENCHFYGSNAMDTDAIDLDNVSNGVIRNNWIYDFVGENSDGIDIGENSENIYIVSNKIYHAGDKGISVGQNSNINVERNIFIGCSNGIAIKDNSYAYIVNNSFFNNDTSISCYEKNIGAGGGVADVLNTILSQSKSSSIYTDQLSSINISYSISDIEPINGEGNLFSNPLFVDSSIYNLQISPNSPCIDSGDPNFQIMNSDPINDIGAYYSYNIDDYPFDIPEIEVNILKVNEFLADNQSINTDQNGEYDDWIELYFNITDTLDLAGYYLTDDFANPEKWMFPDIEIYGEGHLIIWADDEQEQGNLHTNFKLSSEGEVIALFDPEINLIDNISFGEQSSDISYGRVNDGSYYWQFFDNPTPGLINNVIQLSGDINTDGEVNVIDVIMVVNMILGISTIESSADLNQDGIVNVVDIIQIVNIIIVEINIDATTATISRDGESLNISGNGYIGAIQMTLTHYPNFKINLNQDAFVAEYKTDGTTTKLVVVAPKSEKIFTTSDSYVIDEVIVTNSKEIIDVTQPFIFSLGQAYPNPFNPITNIDFSIPKDLFVSINIYDLQGRNITTLTEHNYSAGYHSVTWNAETNSTGLYFVKIVAGDFISSQKIMLVK